MASESIEHMAMRRTKSVRDAREFFLSYSGLQPKGYREAGIGLCNCSQRPMMLYRKNTANMVCAACVTLRQAYNMGEGRLPLRLGMGCYLFISPSEVRFWGNHKMQEENPRIICDTASGKMSEVLRQIVLTPPEPPWMFISFAASTGADMLAITTDTKQLRFSGNTEVNRTTISHLNREQVMTLLRVGMKRAEWDSYLDAYYRCSAADIKPMRELEDAYPALRDIPVLPPRGSAEQVVLRWLLNGTEDAAKAERLAKKREKAA